MVKGEDTAPADDAADAVLPEDTDGIADAEAADADDVDGDEESGKSGRKRPSDKRDRKADKADKSKTRPAGKRSNPVSFVLRFVREVVAELRKVIWPSRKDLITYTVVVVVFLVVMVGLVAMLDLGFARLALIVFGGGTST